MTLGGTGNGWFALFFSLPTAQHNRFPFLPATKFPMADQQLTINDWEEWTINVKDFDSVTPWVVGTLTWQHERTDDWPNASSNNHKFPRPWQLGIKWWTGWNPVINHMLSPPLYYVSAVALFVVEIYEQKLRQVLRNIVVARKLHHLSQCPSQVLQQ